MNAYFASVEQELRPHLRGKPVAVTPVLTPNGSCIAASYEAKKFGVKTGTTVGEARVICPGIIILEARPGTYIDMHHKIIAAVESCIHVEAVLSIDEMVTKLSPSEKNVSVASNLAIKIKQAIRQQAGSSLRCSIGIAPNKFLAKIAADFQKPDGLTIFEEYEIYAKLSTLIPRDLPGIGKNMERRLQSFGIYSVEQLLACSEQKLETIWGGIIGRRWWYNLRGHDVYLPETHRSTLGHSHVLPPELRSEEGAYAVLLRLLHKAAARLRKIDYFCKHLRVSIKYIEGYRWDEEISLPPSQDTLTILESFFILWKRKNISGKPIKVSCSFHKLMPQHCVSLPLFKEDEQRIKLGNMLDRINAKFGTNTLYVAAMQPAKGSAQPRIAFGVIPDVYDPSVR